jgi:hypothetical protein
MTLLKIAQASFLILILTITISRPPRPVSTRIISVTMTSMRTRFTLWMRVKRMKRRKMMRMKLITSSSRISMSMTSREAKAPPASQRETSKAVVEEASSILS